MSLLNNNIGWPWSGKVEPSNYLEGIQYPKISIITPSFNQGQYIEETILSVINQNYPNLEYIIIDGGSTDNTVEIIKKYEKHLAYWVSEKDNGQSDAINKGILRATGEIFNWLNSDDYYNPLALHHVAESFLSGADVVCGKINFLHIDGSSKMSTAFPHSNNIIEVIASTKYLQPSTFYKTKFIKQCNGVNPLLHYCMDYELWLKYLFKNGLAKITNNDKIIVNFRIHDNSKTFLHAKAFKTDMIKLFVAILSHFDINIKKKYASLLGTYKFEIDLVESKKDMIKSAAAHFFYDEVVNAYGQRNFENFAMLLSLLEVNYIDATKKKEIIKMKLREKFLLRWYYKLMK